ncbi:hypothetical protein [Tautonia sociabilis]|uniref:hypothetical protein n=1 Tax=Tautonia sociabilis TaxID=2080755 RepID=UPI0018F62607|nr:hypothetical protein [Tautonia sociabilis]
MNQSASELAVTLSPELYEVLRREAERLGLAIEWLIASLVVDTVDDGFSIGPVVAA